jgi:nucleoside-diphosphate-sugar epimerase
MDVLIAGGHGQVARRLIRLLAGDGHTARGIIRNAAQAGDIEADGGVPVVCDLEVEDVRPHVGAADAIVFAAGAGPGSGPERKLTVDLGAAVTCVEAAEELGVDRFVIVSSIGAEAPAKGPEAMRAYLRAKADADERVAASTLDWTIVRPGSLHDEAGDGRVALSTQLGARGPVARDDVALVLYETLLAPSTIGQTFVVLDGDVPVRDAIRNLPPPPDVPSQ